jgi:hypothetical protein
LDEGETLALRAPSGQARLASFNAPIRRVRGRIEKIFETWKRSYGPRMKARPIW